MNAKKVNEKKKLDPSVCVSELLDNSDVSACLDIVHRANISTKAAGFISLTLPPTVHDTTHSKSDHLDADQQPLQPIRI